MILDATKFRKASSSFHTIELQTKRAAATRLGYRHHDV